MTISILMPVRDAEATLEEALASLVGQTHRDWELIAVDDGSRDSSPGILARWANKDCRIRMIGQQPLGIVAALQRAATEANGDCLARMDADDVSAPRRLELQLARLKSDPKVEVVSCRVETLPSANSSPLQTTDSGGMSAYLAWLNSLLEHEAMARERFIESPLPHPSVLMSRRAYEEIGGYRDQGWPEDYDLWLRMFASGKRFAKLSETLYFWRDLPGRASRNKPRYDRGAFLRCKAHHFVRGPLRGNRPFYQWGAGRYGKSLLRLLIAANRRPLALVDIDPKKIGHRVPNDASGVPVIDPEALPPAGQALVAAAVGSRGSDRARREIRQALAAKGYVEGVDFWAMT